MVLTFALSGFKNGTHEVSVGFKIPLQRLVMFAGEINTHTLRLCLRKLFVYY